MQVWHHQDRHQQVQGADSALIVIESLLLPLLQFADSISSFFQEAGYCTIDSVAMTVKKHLTAIKVRRTLASPSGLLVLFLSRLTFAKRLRILFRSLQGISEAKVDKVLEAINKEKIFSFVTGSQVLRNRQRIKKVRVWLSVLFFHALSV